MTERVTICKEGCKPVWAGALDACPRCESRAVRTTEVRYPEIDLEEILADLEEGDAE